MAEVSIHCQHRRAQWQLAVGCQTLGVEVPEWALQIEAALNASDATTLQNALHLQ